MNITLIGMPGVGKSFIGRQLAEKLNYEFIDIDEIIEKKFKQKLQQILDEKGDDKFIKIEEETVLSLGRIDDYIVSPGGSIVYSEKAMEFLKNNSFIIFLKDSLENIGKRIENKKTRGMVGLKNKSFEELFEERMKLYSKYADVIINISKFDVDKIVEEIIEHIKLIS